MNAADALSMLEEIEDADHKDKLNDWEEEFLESIQEWADSGRDLTEKQQEKLEQIYEKAIHGRSWKGGL
jgi:hypothetical protein